ANLAPPDRRLLVTNGLPDLANARRLLTAWRGRAQAQDQEREGRPPVHACLTITRSLPGLKAASSQLPTIRVSLDRPGSILQNAGVHDLSAEFLPIKRIGLRGCLAG